MKYQSLREEELKNKVAKDYFWIYDCTKIIGNVDFSVCMHQSKSDLFEQEFLMWAEAKTGSSNIYNSIVQLVLTIGKAKTFNTYLPPALLGAFDGEKIAFIPYSEINEVFYITDFNWNVTPSNYETKEFKQIHEKVKLIIEQNALMFFFGKDDKELNTFIKNNFVVGKYGLTKTRIDKNNFIVIYSKWLQAVKPTIAVNWEAAKRNGIIDGDFYLADLLSRENESLKDKLFVLLKKDHYELDRFLDESGMFNSKRTEFTDKQVAHTQFWNKYERPPKEEYWDYIVGRRDLLVPQDVRERKGSVFTPQIWVELSQKYLTDVLGEDWQDEYYVWDCAAGTGNLLNGLTNKYNIWASTLDKQDVEVMRDRISNGANLLEDHVFQFDFLNDEFSKLPKPLQAIINDPEKRKKLVIYINPPYAEASDKKTLAKIGGKTGVEQSKTNKKYAELLGQGNAELFAQFLIRINKEIPNCFISHFSTIKILQGQHFVDFRNNYSGDLRKLFLVPASTFDNVKGKFPIGFHIWDTNNDKNFETILANVYDAFGNEIGKKRINSLVDSNYINDWIKPYRATKLENSIIGKFPFKGNDFQNQNLIALVHYKREYNVEAGQFLINQRNLIVASIYFSVRHCIPATWLNDRDQFLFPYGTWNNDNEFHTDCLVYTLFHSQNKISNADGTNYWIPFLENEVKSREKFESNFMSKFLKGKLQPDTNGGLFNSTAPDNGTLVFSHEAKQVFDAGLELWRYYHVQPKVNVNASLYDIREYFQGRNEKGKMNNKSSDDTYNTLILNLRQSVKFLGAKIVPKVYEYGFLKE
jgi:hypothetical protein